MALQQFDQGADQSVVLEALGQDGACILENYLSPEHCDALMQDFNQSLGHMTWGVDELGYRNEFYGHQTKRLHGLFSRSKHMESVLTQPLMLDLAKQVLLADEGGIDIRLSNCELMVLNQGQTNQQFHTDGGSWYRVQAMEKPKEILLSVNIALSDFTSENGATRVVPGSHLWEAGREPQADEICLATMKKGSALLYSGNVIHSGGENRTSSQRSGLYLGYIVSWLRPIENQLVTNQAEDIFALSDKAKALLDIQPGGFTVIA